MWIKKRHSVAFLILKFNLTFWSKFKYRYKPKKCKEKGPFLIIGNHSLAHDPFLYSLLFRGRIYFLTTDELFRMGFFSKMVKTLVAPVPTRKSTRDSSSIKTLLGISKYKKNICIYPEGATTYCGDPSYIDPAIVKLAKKINYKIAIVNIQGGYQSLPRFCVKSRKGKMTGFIKKIITPEEYQNMTNEELYDDIVANIKVDLLDDVKFRYKRKAEFLETTIYYCSKCNTFENTTSFKNTFKCTNCGETYIVDEYLKMHNNNTVTTISELYHKQQDKINSLSLQDINNLVYTDDIVLSEVVDFVKVEKTKGTLKLINSTLVINDFSFKLDDISSCTTTGTHFLDIYVGDKIYQIRGNWQFSNLKYMNIIFRYKNLITQNDSKYLGI